VLDLDRPHLGEPGAARARYDAILV
jgi:hypothetical protein